FSRTLEGPGLQALWDFSKALRSPQVLGFMVGGIPLQGRQVFRVELACRGKAGDGFQQSLVTFTWFHGEGLALVRQVLDETPMEQAEVFPPRPGVLADPDAAQIQEHIADANRG